MAVEVLGIDAVLLALLPVAHGERPLLLLVVADEHDASLAQVCLAWLRQRGAVPIPKATGREHVADNFESLEVTLSEDAMARIDAIEKRHRVVDFDGAPWDLV